MNQFERCVIIVHKENVKNILLKGEGDWFTAILFRLISKADNSNRAKLFKAFPDEVNEVHKYLTGKDYEATLPGTTNWWRRLLKRNGD